MMLADPTELRQALDTPRVAALLVGWTTDTVEIRSLLGGHWQLILGVHRDDVSRLLSFDFNEQGLWPTDDRRPRRDEP